MSWLRVDDRFHESIKFSGWNAREKWTLLELFSYCARQKTEGLIPDDLRLLPRTVTASFLAKAEASGWVDRDEQNRMVVHDWKLYNPSDATAASRMRAYRQRNGGVTEPVTATVTPAVTKTSPRARASARVPVPSPKELNPEPEPEASYDGAGAGNEIDINQLGPLARGLLDQLERQL